MKEFRAKDRIDALKAPGSTPKMKKKAKRYRALLRFYDTATVLIVGGIMLLLDGFLIRPGTFDEAASLIASIAGCLSMAAIVVLAMESTMAYARMGSYALAFHNPIEYVNGTLQSRFMAELSVLVGLVLAALFVDTAAISMVASIPVDDFGPTDISGVSGLFSAIYEACMTFIFSTQLAPVGPWAKFTVLLISLQGVMILILAFAAFSSSTPTREVS